jgi:ribosomal protein L25 (general stress protein Ctc)
MRTASRQPRGGTPRAALRRDDGAQRKRGLVPRRRDPGNGERRRHRRAGQLEADIIAVDENPLENIRAERDVLLVISNGRIAMNRAVIRQEVVSAMTRIDRIC